MRRFHHGQIIFVLQFLLAPMCVLSFVLPWTTGPTRSQTGLIGQERSARTQLFSERTVQISTESTEEKTTALFAWIARAFAGDIRYGNLMFAIAAIYGDLPDDSPPKLLVKEALKRLPPEEQPIGEPFSVYERESASLGAMGAGQWTGQWRTRPHALLPLDNITSVDDWIKGLPRGCRRTLKKSTPELQNWTVTAHPIRGNAPAPHSSLAHFRCVVEHEIRLLAYSPADFVDALAEAISRYMGTTRMTGEIREYRDTNTGKVIAFAHEVRKGNTIRGQWFYGNDDSAKRYVWFHSVKSLVERAIEEEGVDVVDLGPSGSDDFSTLKARYGFESVDDWPAVANYLGPFWDYARGQPTKNGVEI